VRGSVARPNLLLERIVGVRGLAEPVGQDSHSSRACFAAGNNHSLAVRRHMPIVETQLVAQLEDVGTEVLTLSLTPGDARLDLGSGLRVVVEGRFSETWWRDVPNRLL